MIHFANEKLTLPLSDIFRRLTISEKLSFLLKSQFWSKDELINYQERQLQKLIVHASANVPFYIKWFYEHNIGPEDFNRHEDLARLPVVSKNEIRKDPLQFMAININEKDIIRLNSSGSTGEPFRYLLSRDAFSMKYAAALRGWTWMGYRLGDHYAKLSQNKRPSMLKKIQDMMNRSSYIYVDDLSPDGLRAIIETLSRKKPEYIRCYPDPLQFIAETLRADGKYLSGLKAINSTGNILTPEARKIIEERFRAPVFDSYSCEGSALFYEGPTRENYLGSMEYAITEVLDMSNNEVNSGAPGRHITTDLHNFAMPFIRYDTQDIVEKSSVSTSCGRQLFGLSKITGRESDVLITPSGNRLIVHLFTIYFEYFDCIKRFQIEQTQPDEFIFRLVVDENYDKNIAEQIFGYWQKFLGKDVMLTIEIHDSIPLLYSGKRRFLLRNPEISIPF